MSVEFTAILISPKEEDRWNKLLFNAFNASYRQSFPFEYAQKLNGREIHTFIFQCNGKDVAGAHYSTKSSFENIITIADILAGFVLKEQPDENLVQFLLRHFINWSKQNKASYIRVNPWLVKTLAGVKNEDSELFDKIIRSFGFTDIEAGRHTYWIDLQKDEKTLLDSIEKKARQHIKRAKSLGMEVEIFNIPDDYILELFWKLYSSRSNQKQIPLIEKEYMLSHVSELMYSGFAKLYFAKFEDKMINVSLVSVFGQAASLHSGMNPIVNSDKSIPSPGHFLRWEIINDLKMMGNVIHDMGFSPGPTPIKGHSNYGIWVFKHSFGGDHVEFLPTYGKALKPLRGRLFQYWRYSK